MRFWTLSLTLFSSALAPALGADLIVEDVQPVPELRLERQGWSGVSAVVFAGGGRVAGDDTVGWDTQMRSFISGASAGYDMQFDRIVFGGHVEGIAGNFEDVAYTGNVRQNAEWLASVTARLGYDAGRFMPYVSGGLGFGKYKFTQVQHAELADDDIGYIPLAGDREVTDTDMLYGWVAGAGVEAKLTENVFLRADYKHFHLYDQEFQLADGQPFKAGGKADVVDLGIGYRF
ncbi:porin family protein [Rhodobacterales bacterium]|nr:porin family protein [Rhodobacterales bacterium]